MKKVYSYLCLLLCLFVGAVEVSAQRYVREGDPLSSIPVGEEIVLQAGTSNDGVTTTSSPNNAAADRDGYDFLSGTTKKNSISSEAIYKFVDAGQTSDGLPTYYLQQVATGKYLAAASISYTASKLQAFRFTAQPRQLSDSTLFRSFTKESTAWNAFVLASAKSTAKAPVYLECLYYGQGVSLAKWQDCNVWQVYKFRPANGAETLTAVLEEFFPNGYNAEAYIIGNGPGQYTQESINALTAAFNAAAAANLDTSVSDERKAQLAAELETAYKAAMASAKEFSAGVYYLLNWRNGTNNSQVSDAGPFDAAYAAGTAALWSTGFTVPSTADADVTYIWQFEDAGDGSFHIKNFGTGKYLYNSGGAGSAYTLVEEASRHAFTVTKSAKYNGYFEIKDKAAPDAGYSALHTQVAGKKIVNWTTDDAGASVWRFATVGDLADLQQKLDSVNAANAQAALNDSLTALYATARATIAGDKTYLSDATRDGKFPVSSGLVVAASQLRSNATEPTEGSLDKLLDGDLNSFFHTVWSQTSPSAPHNLIVDLGQPVENLVLKYAERNNDGNGDPKGITVYASNDTTDNQWTKIDDLTFTYAYKFTAADGTESARKAGLASVELGAPYQYVRLDVNTTYGGGTTADAEGKGRYWWYLSEFRAYKATYDAANSTYEDIKTKQPEVVANVEAAITAAKDDLSDGVATQAVYDRLKKAYAAYKAFSPDVANVTAPLSVLKSFVTAAQAGTDPGYYPQQAITDAQAVITEVETTLAAQTVFTVQQIADLVAKVKEARTAFDAALILLKLTTDGKYYLIRSTTSGAAANNYLYAANSATGDDASQATIKWGGYDVTTGGQDANLAAGNRLNYVWEVTEVGHGQYTFKNLYTGTYLRANKRNNVVERMSATPDTLIFRSARLAGSFNLLTVPDGSVMLNAQPGYHNLVTWDNGQGNDNSAFTFEATIPTGTMYLPIRPTETQILTLPFEVESNFAEGKAYVVAGRKDGKVQLTAAPAKIAGGTPFVFVPNVPTDSVAEIAVYPEESYDAITYAAAPLHANGLYGTLHVDTATTVSGKLFMAPVDDQWYVTKYDNASPVAPNSGYFVLAEIPQTSEAGVATLNLDPDYIDGVGTITVVPSPTVGAVYTLSGVKVRNNGATKGLPAGIYIVNGRKVYVK